MEIILDVLLLVLILVVNMRVSHVNKSVKEDRGMLLLLAKKKVMEDFEIINSLISNKNEKKNRTNSKTK